MTKHWIERRVTVRYSDILKQKIVNQIENGELSIHQAGVQYGIKGGSTISGWLKKMGKNHLLSRRVRIETLEEMTEIERLKKRLEEIEQGLVQTQLNNLQNEGYLAVACSELGISVEDFKKKTSPRLVGSKTKKP